jgi:hypothetical protein
MMFCVFFIGHYFGQVKTKVVAQEDLELSLIIFI